MDTVIIAALLGISYSIITWYNNKKIQSQYDKIYENTLKDLRDGIKA